MAKLAVEFHDGTLMSVRREGADSVLVMNLFILSSDGRPGWDAGVGWYQDAEVRLRDAEIQQGPAVPLDVIDGVVQVNDQAYPDVLDLPCDLHGQVTVTLSGTEGVFGARAKGIRVELLGEPGDIEPFPGADAASLAR